MEITEREALFGRLSSRQQRPATSRTTGPEIRGVGEEGNYDEDVGGWDDAANGGGGAAAAGGTGRSSTRGGVHECDKEPPQQQQQEQRQQQHLSWDQARDRMGVAERQQGLRSAYESVEIGRETLERLDDQKERLERSEMVLDSTGYAIERSARVLRGMTFWGKLKNAFSDDPLVPQMNRSDPNTTAGGEAEGEAGAGVEVLQNDDDAPLEGFVCPDCRRSFQTAATLVAHFGSEHTTSGVGGVGGGGGGVGVRKEHATKPSPRPGTSSSGATQWGDDARRRTSGDGGRGHGHSHGHGGGMGEADESNVSAGISPKDQLFGRRGGHQPSSTTTASSGGNGRGGGGVVAEQKAFMAAQDEYLDSVGKAVAELGLLGRNIGGSLDGQGVVLQSVTEKIEETNDRTAFVTRKAARMAQASASKKPTFVMSVALQEVSTGLFLTVTGEDVGLLEKELRNVCRFDAWQRQEGIFGFKSGATGRWLGQTFLGYLRASGTSFGRNYEWQADLRRKETTLVCCSANWGAGGYLSARFNENNNDNSKSKSSTSATSAAINPALSNNDNNTNNNNSSRSSSSGPPLPAEKVELSLVDATLQNKHRAAVFRVINCAGYTPQPFIGGRLMRNPTPPDGERTLSKGIDGGGGGGKQEAGVTNGANTGW